MHGDLSQIGFDLDQLNRMVSGLVSSSFRHNVYFSKKILRHFSFCYI